MKFIIKILKNIEYFSAIAMRLTKFTGKSNVPLHPKHLTKSKVWFARHLKKNDLVLDLGSGNGQTSIKIANSVKKVIGFEINDSLVKRAQEEARIKNLINAEFLVGDANQKLPFKNYYFDKMICSDVLEHLYKRDFALSEMKRVLKPAGILFLVIDNPDTSWKHLQKSNGLFYYADADHKYEYPKKEITVLLKNNGFQIISIKPDTYDTPLKPLIDLAGGFSLTLYSLLSNWRRKMVLTHPSETTGFRIIAKSF
jgi:ubiquinone/menaquinone biosynthesis C-methylase UbiE